jgi:FMN reductase
MFVLGLDGSPQGHGRTEAVLRTVLAGAERVGATTEIVSLKDVTVDEAIDRADSAGGIVFGSPVYRASIAFPLKGFLDHLPRGLFGETRAPLQGKPTAIVATGATLHHFLALGDIRNVLASFFAAHVVPPGLYVPRDGFDAEGRLIPEYAERATEQGRALMELSTALSLSPTLRALLPQA